MPGRLQIPSSDADGVSRRKPGMNAKFTFFIAISMVCLAFLLTVTTRAAQNLSSSPIFMK